MLVRLIRAIVVVGVCAACQGPVAATNGMVWVANLGQADGSLHWQSPGLFGTGALGASGTEPVRACSLYGRSFGAGDQQITITSASATRSFTLPAPSEGQATLWYVIGADGAIAETTEGKAPASPYCAP